MSGAIVPRIVQLRGEAKMSEEGRKVFDRLHIVRPGPKTETISAIAESERVLSGLALQMEQAIAKATSSDGRIDFKTAAAHLMATMRMNQR